MILSRVEATVGLAVMLIAGALIVAIGSSAGWTSEVLASWVQAIGSIVAIFVVATPVLLQRRLERATSRKLVLATAEKAYEAMEVAANRHLNPTSFDGSEWRVPQWEILRRRLADAPIEQTGSEVALRSFMEFQALFDRAVVFDDTDSLDPALKSFTVSLMVGASGEMSALRAALS